VGGSFYIMNCDELLGTPDDLTVNLDLHVSGCRADIVIGSGLNVGSDLYLPEGFDTSTIPDDAKIGGLVCIGSNPDGVKLEDIRSRQQGWSM